MEQTRLRAPADMQRGVNIGGGPIHDLHELVPIVDVREIELLDRGAGDDQPVEALVAHLVERAVERLEMLGRDVLGLVARVRSSSTSICRGVLESFRMICVSVAILVGMRFKISTRSGRMS